MSKRLKLVVYMVFWAVVYSALGTVVIGPPTVPWGYLGTGVLGAGLGWFIWMLFVEIGTGKKN